jgi:hypothetical protein
MGFALTLRGLTREGVPLDADLLQLPRGFKLVNPTFKSTDSEILILGPVGRCSLTGTIAHIWKSLPGPDARILAPRGEIEELEALAAVLTLIRMGLVCDQSTGTTAPNYA